MQPLKLSMHLPKNDPSEEIKDPKYRSNKDACYKIRNKYVSQVPKDKERLALSGYLI